MRDLPSQQFRELLTGNTMRVKHGSEPFHHTGPHVDSATDHPIGDGLHSLGDPTKDSKLVAAVREFRAL